MANANIPNNFQTSFIVGKIYNNDEINKKFSCSTQQGMAKSRKNRVLVLFVRHYKKLYDDNWDENNILHYTGMGPTGDQDENYSQNKTLKESRTNNIKVFLFEAFKANENYFRGEVELAGNLYTVEELDLNGKPRNVIKFPLRLKDNTEIEVDKENLDDIQKEKQIRARKCSYDELKEAAKSNNGKARKIKTKTTTIVRNEAVSEFTKRRANGICDLCDHPAPFIDKDGVPYLECHHVKTLADGGPDAIYNTVALCPNCHRRMHKLKDSKDKTKLKKKIKYYLERDNETELLIEFKKLFGK